MNTRMRMIAAGAAVALLTGTAGAAAATASPSSSAPKPSPTGTDSGGKPGDQQTWLYGLAASFHVSPQQLNTALVDAKQTIGRLGVAPLDPAVVAVVTRDLSIGTSQATDLIREVFGDGPASGKGDRGDGAPGKTPASPGTPDRLMTSALAGILHVSDARAAQVLEQLYRIAQPDRGISPQDPQFQALAGSLHLTPQQLADALTQMKRTLAASMQSSSSSPAPGSS